MTHPLTGVLEEISVVREQVQAPWFRKHADQWMQAIRDQIAADLASVDCLQRLDAKADEIKAAKDALCTTMGIDLGTDMVVLLQTADVVFKGFVGLDTCPPDQPDAPDQPHPLEVPA